MNRMDCEKSVGTDLEPSRRHPEIDQVYVKPNPDGCGYSSIRRINHLAPHSDLCAQRHRRVNRLSRRHQMIDCVAAGEEMVHDDPAMASPPYRLRTHDRDPAFASQLHQFSEGAREILSERKVGIVVEALNAPHCI